MTLRTDAGSADIENITNRRNIMNNTYIVSTVRDINTGDRFVNVHAISDNDADSARWILQAFYTKVRANDAQPIWTTDRRNGDFRVIEMPEVAVAYTKRNLAREQRHSIHMLTDGSIRFDHEHARMVWGNGWKDES